MALKIKTEEEYQNLLAHIKDKRTGGPTPDGPSPLPGAGKRASRLALGANPGAAAGRTPENCANPPGAKRKGVKETPILASLRDCSIEVEASPTHMTIAFKGARLFTLNEIYAMLQYRSYIIFAYKKQWHALVLNALRLAGKNKPSFDGPCKVTLFRQGSKKVDRDSLMVMFKYIIDALKHEPKNKHVGLFSDDNPDIVYDDEKIQLLGEPIVGIRVEQIPVDSIKPDLTLADLFDRVPPSLAPPSASEAAPSGPRGKKTKTRQPPPMDPPAGSPPLDKPSGTQPGAVVDDPIDKKRVVKKNSNKE